MHITMRQALLIFGIKYGDFSKYSAVENKQMNVTTIPITLHIDVGAFASLPFTQGDLWLSAILEH
eukprot:9235506-Ditylum_brightwellii.AAC.1